MVELPRLSDGTPCIVCNTCPAKSWVGGGYLCDERELGETNRPLFCPLRSSEKQKSLQAYAMLRSQLRGQQ